MNEVQPVKEARVAIAANKQRKVLTLPKELVARVREFRHDRRLEVESDAYVVLLEMALGRCRAGADQGGEEVVTTAAEKNRARRLASEARKAGRLRPLYHCAECGPVAKVEMHHPDYSKPLEVVWLCSPCHKRLHKYDPARANWIHQTRARLRLSQRELARRAGVSPASVVKAEASDDKGLPSMSMGTFMKIRQALVAGDGATVRLRRS